MHRKLRTKWETSKDTAKGERRWTEFFYGPMDTDRIVNNASKHRNDPYVFENKER